MVFGIALGLTFAGVRTFAAGRELRRREYGGAAAIPNFALVPLLIVWFGISEVPKIMLITLAVAVAIYINTFSAIRSVDAGLVEAARSFGAGAPS